jgi:predicted hydrolase (HD superfamily)
MNMTPDRDDTRELLHSYVASESLQLHCEMVATAMEGYARKLEKSDKTADTWWTAGLLHDLDWEKFPEDHPNKAVKEILPNHDYDKEIIRAVEAHAPDRTGRQPETEIERYLFACDEISGFMKAVALMRPNGFSDMKIKSVTKKLKDKKFAENVPREDVRTGANLINLELRDHIQNLITFFKDRY